MQVSVKTTNGLEREVKVAVPAESFEAKVDERIKAAAGDVRLPGFRPGKVPLKEVRRRFGTELRRQVVTDMLQSSFADVIRQEQLALASQASISLDNIEPGGDLEYTATFEVMPTVQLADLTTLQVGKPKAEVTETDIDETVKSMRMQRRTWRGVERAAQEGDRVSVDYSVKVAGKVVEDPTRQSFVVGDPDNLDEVNGALVGVVAKETRVFPTTASPDLLEDADDEGEDEGEEAPGDNPEAETLRAESDGSSDAGDPVGDLGEQDVDPDALEASSVSNAPRTTSPVDLDALEASLEAIAEQPPAPDIDSPDDDGSPDEDDDEEIPAIAEIDVYSVEEPVLPELDDDFFDSFDIDSEGDRHAKFREQVRGRMQMELDDAIRRAMRQQVRSALVRAHDFELPQAMVTAELANRVEQIKRVFKSLDPADIAEMHRPAAEESVRATLALREVVRHARIEPDDHRVRARVEEIASAYEEAAEVRRWLYSDEEQLQRIENAVAEEQAVEYVLSQANAIAVSLSYRDVVSGVVAVPPEAEQTEAPAQPPDVAEEALPAPTAAKHDDSAEDSGAEDSGAEDSGAEDSGAEDSGAEDSERASGEAAGLDEAAGGRGFLRRFFRTKKD